MRYANTAKTHQMKIAKATMRMTVQGALCMGGMDHATAYELIYREPLLPRLRLLAAEDDGTMVCELTQYGWKPGELLKALEG